MYDELTAWLAAWRQWQARAVADVRPRWAVDHQIMFDLELTPSALERAGAPPALTLVSAEELKHYVGSL